MFFIRKQDSKGIFDSDQRKVEPAPQDEATSLLPTSPRTARRRQIRILLFDPRPLTAIAVRTYLEGAVQSDGTAHFRVTVAPSCDSLREDQDFDLILLHISASAGVDAQIRRCLGAIPAVCRTLPVVIYADAGGLTEVAAAMSSGARGYLLSSLSSDRFVEALELLASGLSVFPAEALQEIPENSSHVNGSATPRVVAEEPSFTSRELDVLKGLHAGKPNKVIARDLGLSSCTVKVHVRSLFKKLGVHNRTEAAIAAGSYLPLEDGR